MNRNRTGKKKRGRYAPAAVALAVLLLTACGQKADELNENSLSAPSVSVPAQESGHTQEDKGPDSEASPNTDNEAIPETGTPPTKTAQESPASVSDQVTLDGSIETIGNGMITIRKTFAEVADDGSAIGWSSKEDVPVFDISYTDQTVVIIRSTTDNGITYTDAPGSAADLKKDRSIMASGAWDGDIFRANEIVIFHFG